MTSLPIKNFFSDDKQVIFFTWPYYNYTRRRMHGIFGERERANWCGVEHPNLCR